MSKLMDKARAFHEQPAADVRPAADSQRPRTGIGAFSASLAVGRQVEEQNRQLKDRLAEYEGAPLVRMLDPESIQPSRFANRSELAYATQEFEDLKAQIAAVGRNVQPIKVRPVAGHEGRYEVVYGHRRLRACKELGLQVGAVVSEMTDKAMVIEMDLENRGRANLSAWEQGVAYKRILDTGVFPSLRAMGEELECSSSTISRAIAIATLPEEVIAAFPSPLDVQFRWGQALHDAVNRDLKHVLSVCREIAEMRPRPSAVAVFGRIVNAGPDRPGKFAEVFEVGGKKAGVFERDSRGNIVLRIRGGSIGLVAEKKLRHVLQQIFEDAGK